MKPSSAILFAGLTALAFAGPAFAAESDKGTETILHAFNPQKGDGTQPVPGMVDLSGTLYGSTISGGEGTLDYGTVYALDPKSGAEKIVYSFCSLETCEDGAFPNPLIGVNGTLYGTTEHGGKTGKHGVNPGVIFALDPGTGAETVVYDFPQDCDKTCPQGGYPEAGLTYGNGLLYGTTSYGGSNPQGGVIFSVDPGSGKEQSLYSFCSRQNCADGQDPQSMIYVNGILYGTTYAGGSGTNCEQYYAGCGTVFSFDPATGTETVLYSFCSQQNCTDGALVNSGLIDENNVLYGTTSEGGASNCGEVFAVDPNTGAETVIHSFQGSADGCAPTAPLAAWKGELYGSTAAGGTYNEGALFEMDPGSGNNIVLHSFGAKHDGEQPNGGLLAAGSALYGTTLEGHHTCGPAGGNCGTAFSWKP